MNWRRISHCDGSSACIEVCHYAGFVGLRDSEQPGQVVWFTSETLKLFIDDVKVGKLAE